MQSTDTIISVRIATSADTQTAVIHAIVPQGVGLLFKGPHHGSGHVVENLTTTLFIQFALKQTYTSARYLY
jgi:hypothetical protein